MNGDLLLSLFVHYGLPVLAGVILVASVGLPLPASLLLIAAGAFVAQGQFPHGWTVVVATLAAVAGDSIGFGLGHWGGPGAIERISRWTGPQRQRQATHLVRRWGGLGIFLSRWLVSPLGPALNLTSGLSGYPWWRFLIYDLAGELVWVGLYTTVGYLYSDRIQAVAAVLGDLSWALCGVLGVSMIGWYGAHRHGAAHARQRQRLRTDRATCGNYEADFRS